MRRFLFSFLMLLASQLSFGQGYYKYVVKINAFGEAYSTTKTPTRISIDDEKGIITVRTGKSEKVDTIFVNMVYAMGGEGMPVKFTQEMCGYEAVYVCEWPNKPDEAFVFVFRTVTDKRGQDIKGRIAWIERKDGTKTSFLSD